MPADAQPRSDLARRLTAAVATPVLLLVLIGVILGRQILQMTEDARWLDHSDQVIALESDTVKQVIDQETGLRGYLVTADRLFLEPYTRAHPEVGFRRLAQLVADNPPQQARFEEARRRYEEWQVLVKPLLEGKDLDRAREDAVMRDRKDRMDGIREAMNEALVVEQGLRRERVAASAASAQWTKWVFLFLLTMAAAVLAFLSRWQLRAIATTFVGALGAEAKARAATELEAWIRAGQARLVDALQGERTVEQLGAECLAVLAGYVRADVGAFFTAEGSVWRRVAGYALDARAAGPERFPEGEGVVGRVASERRLLHLRDVPADFLKLRSGTGEAAPSELVVVPACVDGAVNAVFELGFLRPPDAQTLELLGRVAESVAVAVRSSEYKHQLRELLEEAQRQAEELQTQQEELRVANEELETQALALQASREKLEAQKAELKDTNANLLGQSQLLERQNQRLAETQAEIEAKAREVERASRYKSEFLSNMSHELRTPLNSSLILAKLLADNRTRNLTADQVRSAETIYSAGNDLLALINDILDLSKIEAGKMDVHAAAVSLEELREHLVRTFEPVAREKGLPFSVELPRAAAAATVETDGPRLEQILKNLVSNALKFTEEGHVVVDVAMSPDRLLITVRDTGIGIAESQREMIFDAFRQADGTTNRKYGGTGLGLSISRELAHLLGGEITVESEVGKGSLFALSLPRVYAGPTSRVGGAMVDASPPVPPSPPPLREPVPELEDEHTAIEPGRRLVLVVEDDHPFATVLADIAREAGFQCLVASTALRGFQLAKKFVPMGIVLDVTLPDHTGLSVLDRLKRDPVTRHIPVHIISASDYAQTALAMGALAYSVKPVNRDQILQAFRQLEARSTRRLRCVLVVEDDENLRGSVAKLLGRDDVEIATAASAQEALELLRDKTFDCVVTDLTLPDRSGLELLEAMAGRAPGSAPPVIVYTGRVLEPDEEQRLRRYSSSIIVKGARSPERLLDEVTLFLHQVEAELPEDQRRILEEARHREAVFEGRTILVVEDDVRNIFALTSILEPKGVRVDIARNGKEALRALERSPRVDLVLMDIMMPEMDGLEATRRIRQDPRWSKLPVLALTSKAMKDDQERCLAAGANDYLAKPLDVEMLMSLLRVWMPKA